MTNFLTAKPIFIPRESHEEIDARLRGIKPPNADLTNFSQAFTAACLEWLEAKFSELAEEGGDWKEGKDFMEAKRMVNLVVQEINAEPRNKAKRSSLKTYAERILREAGCGTAEISEWRETIMEKAYDQLAAAKVQSPEEIEKEMQSTRRRFEENLDSIGI